MPTHPERGTTIDKRKNTGLFSPTTSPSRASLSRTPLHRTRGEFARSPDGSRFYTASYLHTSTATSPTLYHGRRTETNASVRNSWSAVLYMQFHNSSHRIARSKKMPVIEVRRFPVICGSIRGVRRKLISPTSGVLISSLLANDVECIVIRARAIAAGPHLRHTPAPSCSRNNLHDLCLVNQSHFLYFLHLFSRIISSHYAWHTV